MIWQSIILGITQGFTEFLPVSSSGHLVLLKDLFNISTPGAFFESILHLGTLCAVLIYFYKKLFSLDINFILTILVATLPVAIIGVLLQDPIESLFSSTKLVGFSLLITGLINLNIDKFDGRKEKIDKIDSVFIGLAQSIAIIPGISRSGSTIFAAKYLNIESSKAAEFSFLLSLPAIAGANLLQFISHGFELGNEDLSFYFVGFLAAFISGLFAIDMMIKLLAQKKLKYFAVYCFLLGFIAIFIA